ncbi:zinc finger BED domain-containing protein DAYSLEEPER-like isoform X2 [Abrus precatorius]|uniref:Zinc finger BED domain-containing protein DAYSLEEPER-like isoform X2 n=1 Tax=Abrus precatorius TaxID=3816 RepID=A0A8B8JG49_ABRPR|nr:zinc finger BED domain-containing protein DAYSLEEPER-like isoform X2 [Abrus precatorius]XP_027330425.1 zinc finger BED domain-containing protein DAYSLEEPER-like isoform X2 [Abrus precatorius]XP_027330426.1 zinc finger BED domain-containing protein DAYSLEEPER-like isoform X2 [Abrus precatorius]XP_027330427.1 zinc finger BED domain-containing protein DAYSLEEPER-like isoform X2 [Abrus precatorius]
MAMELPVRPFTLDKVKQEDTYQDKMVAVEEDKVVAAPDVKNAPVSTDFQTSNDVANSENHTDSNVDNSASQPNEDLSNSKAESNKGLPASETQPSIGDANEVTLPNQELNNTKQRPHSGLENSESLPNNQSTNVEDPHINQPVDSEAPTKNTSASSEAPGDDKLASSEATLDQNPASEAPSSDQLVNSETLPNNGVVNSEQQTSNDVVASETQHSNKVAVSETHHSNEVVLSETQQSNEVVMSETQLSSDVVMSDAQPNTKVVMPDTQLGSETVIPETQPNHDTVIQEAQTGNDVVMSESLAENELANSATNPNTQLSHTESLSHNHQFSDLHMIPEDQLPQPESLPNSDPLPSSEPLADSHLTDIKPIPHNHLAQYDTLPNNHMDHSEVMPNHQLTHSETLSHEHLANSQMLSHYELENSEALHDNRLVSSQPHYEIVNATNVPSYEIVNAETPLSEEPTPDTQPNKRRKKKSIVWEHFTIETVSAGCRRACCKQCKQSFAYSTGSKVAGTSHLKRHIAKGTCPALLRNQDPNQLTPYTPRSRGSGAGNASSTPKRRYRSPSTPYIIFDQDRCRHEIARMIIMHDYPLHMVEHPGFVAFVQNLQPQFNMVTFNTVQGDCVATYLMEKQNLMKYFEGLPGRVCLTLDVWTSSQSVGYVFITGHFVDSDWKLQRRILNVVMEPYPNSDSALSHAVAVCLSDWNLEGRLFSITCNQTLSEVALGNLRPLLSVKNPLILNGQLLVGNCIARTLSNVANDLLSSVHGIVKKIRDSVKYVKTSESHEEKFLELKQQLQVPSERNLFIDDQTQWNTTYQMLVAASELKEVFSCLDTSDPDYKGAPSMQDWKLVETLCTYLKPIFDAVNILTTTTHPTAITFFHEVWKLQLDLARAVVNEDPFISNLTKPMQEKVDKYWKDCSLVLAIAVVMDPRFKMKLVEFSFTKVYGDDAHMYVKIVDDGIHELFHEYVTLPLPLTPAYAEEGSAGSQTKTEGSPGGTLLSDNGLTDFDVYIMETTNQQMKSELDQYLEESLLPRVPDFDVLGWWKLNKLKYPTLSKMARDILSVPVSSVPPDSVFDTKVKEMDQYRSSLRPETVEALVCAKDWMHYGAAEASNALVKMEF